MQNATIITRSFQSWTGVNGKEFDEKSFAEKVASPIRELLNFQNIQNIVVVTNGEKGNRLAEIVTNNECPTTLAIKKYFPEEIESRKIIPHICYNWGKNPGSGEALNEGLRCAETFSSKWVLNWSPEIKIDGYFINQALTLAEQRSLSVVGGLRQRWWLKPQWIVAQNTAALWRTESLLKIGGFSPECNGTGESVQTKDFGNVPLAGMEDFHAMIRMMKNDSNFRWGMIKRSSPLRWDTNFEPGSGREANHLRKVARQYLVMQAYVSKIFDTKNTAEFEDVMDKFFSKMHLE